MLGPLGMVVAHPANTVKTDNAAGNAAREIRMIDLQIQIHCR
jgi:hypothetical protein